VSARRGLPTAVKMRHDQHYVDSLLFKEGEVVGRMIPIEQIFPNPHQPRKDLGDIEMLAQSIREHGVLEPILVTKEPEGYQIVSGERRYVAAEHAELRQMPCIVKNLKEREILEIALVENLQRKDLHPFEEADGLHTLVQRYRYTHDMLAQRIGKSRSSVSETLAIAGLEPEVRAAAREAEITAKSMLLTVAKKKTVPERLALIERIAAGARRDEIRRSHRTQQKPKPFVYKFRAPDKTFSLDLKFKRSQVSKKELIACIEAILEQIRAED